MDGNLAMANSLENGAEPADIFEYEYGFNKRQAVALESLYMDESLAGKYQTIHDFAKRAQRLLLTDESSGLHKHSVSVSLLSIENTDKYAKKWADNFGEIGDTNYSIALTSYRRGLKKAAKIISNAR